MLVVHVGYRNSGAYNMHVNYLNYSLEKFTLQPQVLEETFSEMLNSCIKIPGSRGNYESVKVRQSRPLIALWTKNTRTVV